MPYIISFKPTLQEDKQSVCLQLPLFLLLIVCFARTKSPTATIYLAQPFLGRHILRRVFHSGKLGPPQGRLTQETIALSPQGCLLCNVLFFAANFLRESSWKDCGLRGSAICGFCVDLEKALDVVMCKSQDVKPVRPTLNQALKPRNLAGPKCGQAGT